MADRSRTLGDTRMSDKEREKKALEDDRRQWPGRAAARRKTGHRIASRNGPMSCSPDSRTRSAGTGGSLVLEDIDKERRRLDN